MKQDAKADFFIDPVTGAKVTNDADEAPLYFNAHGAGRFHRTSSVAVWAIGIGAAGMTFAMALTRHLHDAEGGYG